MSRKLIYEYRSDGTYMPCYTYCKVYNDGLLVAGDGDLWPPEEKNKDKHHASMKLPREAIRDIERIIDQNYQIFSIKELEDDGPIILDGTNETLKFSDEKNRATFRIDNLDYRISRHKSDSEPETPNLDLVGKVYTEIRKILISNGLSEEHF